MDLLHAYGAGLVLFRHRVCAATKLSAISMTKFGLGLRIKTEGGHDRT